MQTIPVKNFHTAGVGAQTYFHTETFFGDIANTEMAIWRSTFAIRIYFFLDTELSIIRLYVTTPTPAKG